MKPPTKFEIMRINRGYQQYVNRRAELLAMIDSAELDVLRTLHRKQKEERYETAERIAQAMEQQPTGPKPGEFVERAASSRGWWPLRWKVA